MDGPFGAIHLKARVMCGSLVGVDGPKRDEAPVKCRGFGVAGEATGRSEFYNVRVTILGFISLHLITADTGSCVSQC